MVTHEYDNNQQAEINHMHNVLDTMQVCVDVLRDKMEMFPRKTVPLSQPWLDLIAKGEAKIV